MARQKSGAKIFRGGGTFNQGGQESISKKMFHFANVAKLNKTIFFVFFLIVLIGIINLIAVSPVHAIKQMVYVLIFSPLFIAIIAANPRYFIKFAYPAFGFSLFMLASLFVIGDISMGAS